MIRNDLPPITRKLNTQLNELESLGTLDAGTAAVIQELGSHILNAIADLENEIIISRE